MSNEALYDALKPDPNQGFFSRIFNKAANWFQETFLAKNFDAAVNNPTVGDKNSYRIAVPKEAVAFAHGHNTIEPVAFAQPVNMPNIQTRSIDTPVSENDGLMPSKQFNPPALEMQKKLAVLGYDLERGNQFKNNGVDGFYGNATIAAVKDFQIKNGLNADGIAGAETLAALEQQFKASGKEYKMGMETHQNSVTESFIKGAQDTYNSARKSFLAVTKITPENDLIKQEALEKAKDLLVQREGVAYTTYYDSVGKLTGGIGHLILPEDKLKHGDKIPKETVDKWFEKDVAKAFDAAYAQASELGKQHNPEFLASLTSVNYQLGTGWRNDFNKTWAKLKDGDFNGAIQNIKRSLWHEQTPKRTSDFVESIKTAFTEEPSIKPSTTLASAPPLVPTMPS